jgi:hypothetical protein
MNFLKTLILGAMLSCITITVNAQSASNKETIFAALPATINVDNMALVNAVAYNKGNTVNLAIANNLQFEGSVLSNVQKYDNLQIVTIQSVTNENTFLEISKITHADLSVQYKGMLINSNATDGFILKQNNGVYALEKFETAKILQDCKQ